MRKSGGRLLQMILFMSIMTLIGCANQQEYQKAFDSQHSLNQNQCTFTQSSDSIIKEILRTQNFIRISLIL